MNHLRIWSTDDKGRNYCFLWTVECFSSEPRPIAQKLHFATDLKTDAWFPTCGDCWEPIL